VDDFVVQFDSFGTDNFSVGLDQAIFNTVPNYAALDFAILQVTFITAGIYYMRNGSGYGSANAAGTTSKYRMRRDAGVIRWQRSIDNFASIAQEVTHDVNVTANLYLYVCVYTNNASIENLTITV
jgi:hypothetical protein